MPDFDDTRARLSKLEDQEIRRRLDMVEERAGVAADRAEKATEDLNGVAEKLRRITAIVVGREMEEEGGIRGEFRKHQIEAATLTGKVMDRLEALAKAISEESSASRRAFKLRDRIAIVIAAAVVGILSPELVGAITKAAAKIFVK